MKKLLFSSALVSGLLLFPTTARSFYTATELSYQPRNAKGVHGLAQYLDGISQVNLVNGNLIFSRNLVSRPGRAGFAANLGLTYNSKLWDRSGNNMIVSELGSTYGLGLGWTLTMGRLIEGTATYAVVFPDGSAHEIVDYSEGDWKSVDSSYIRLDPVNKVATLPGGTRLTYGQTVGNVHHVTMITDRNGNQIEVEYVTGTGKIRRVDDTLGPLAVFTYDANGFLDYVENYGKPRRNIYFTYEDASLTPNFTLTSQPPSGEKLLAEIAFSWSWPAKDLKQVFTYNSYGEITQIDNVVQDYVYVCDPRCEWDPSDSSTQTLETYQYETKEFYDATHSSVEERLVKKQTRKFYNIGSTLSRDFTITYTIGSADSNPSHVRVADVKGNTHYDFHYTSNGRDWTDGLVSKAERRSGGALYSGQETTWTQDNPASTVLENPRVSSQTKTLENGLSTSVDYTYLTDGTGNVEEVTENDFDGEPLRKTIYRYLHETTPAYDTYHLTTLVETVEVQDDLGNPLAKTFYGYDETPLTHYPSLTFHDPTYDVNFTVRGNRTSSASYFSEESRWITNYSQYDIAGNVVKTIDPLNRETTMTYESDWYYSLLESTGNNLDQTTQFEWQTYTATIDGQSGQTYASGEPKTVTDPNGIVVSRTSFDTLGRVKQKVTPVDTEDFRYDDLTYLASLSSASGYQYHTSGPGGASIEQQQWDPVGDNIVTSRDYDICGSPSWKAPHRSGTPGSNGWITYDALCRPLRMMPPGGGGASYDYHGNEVTVTRGGHDKRYTYNVSGQVISVLEEDDLGVLNIETTYNYDPIGRLIRTTQGVQTRTLVYDSLGRLTSETHPENGTTTFTYYDDGQLETTTDALGVVTTLAYDALGRLKTRSYSDSTPSVTFHYDETTTTEIPTITNSVGRMTSAWTSDNIGYTWSYDEMGRPVEHVASIDGTDYPTTYNYDAAGCGCSTKDLLQIVYPNGFKIDYVRDDIGRILEVKAPVTRGFNNTVQDYVASVIYGGKAGQVTSIASGGGTNYNFTFDGAGRPTQIHVDSGWPYQTWDYTYGGSGRIRQIFQTRQTASTSAIKQKKYTYAYDEWHRLKTAKREDRQNYGNWSINDEFDFQYDRYNNLTKRQKLSGLGPTWTFAIDTETNQVISRTGGTARYYSYNAAGQVTFDTLRNFDYTYDGANRLISVDKSTTNKGTYRYDAFGRRVTRDPGDVIYIYGAQGELLLEDHENSSSPKSIYHIQMEGRLIATRTIGNTEDKIRFLFRNHLSDVKVTETIDLNYQYAQGAYCRDNFTPTACDRWDFQNYDIPFPASEDAQFQGHEYDDSTFLNYMGARFYNPDLMRWMSPDPVTQLSPHGMNRYTYVGNDPIHFVDQNGMYRECVVATAHCVPAPLPRDPVVWEIWPRPGHFFPSTRFFGEELGGGTLTDLATKLSECLSDEQKAAGLYDKYEGFLSEVGVTPKRWANLSVNQRAGMLNMMSVVQHQGLPLEHMTVFDIQEDRVFFGNASASGNPGTQAWFEQITSSSFTGPHDTEPSHHYDNHLSYKTNVGGGSINFTFGTSPSGGGGKLFFVDVDIDLHGGKLGHAWEAVSNAVRRGRTNPFEAYKVLKKGKIEAWDCP